MSLVGGNPAAVAMKSSCWKAAGMEDAPLPRLRNVFVYGTLLAPEIVNVLIERIPRSAPAWLSDHRRFSLRGRTYPAAVPFPEAKLLGKVLYDLTDEELAVLDAFEDIDYTKELVEPVLQVDEKQAGANLKSRLQAIVYVWANVKDDNLYGEWDCEEFREKYLEEYVEMCKEFISEYYKSR